MIKSKNSYKKMKISVRLSGVLVAFLIFSCQVYAQSNAINKLLNKKEYEAAFEKITSAYKDTNDLERTELMFKYYSAVDNPSFNSCLAYSYANRYNLQTAGDKIELDDFVRTSLDIAFKSGSIEELEQFIECFKEQTTYVKEAMRLVEQLAFEQASMEGTLEAFEWYVEKYPASLQSSLAKQNIDKLIVEQILESDDLQTLRDFAATSNNKQHAHEYEYPDQQGPLITLCAINDRVCISAPIFYIIPAERNIISPRHRQAASFGHKSRKESNKCTRYSHAHGWQWILQ